jgi:hypothetical protein
MPGLLDDILSVNAPSTGLMGALPVSYAPSAPDKAEEKEKRDAALSDAIAQNPYAGFVTPNVTPLYPNLFGGASAPMGVQPGPYGGSSPFGLGGINLPPSGTPASGPFSAAAYSPLAAPILPPAGGPRSGAQAPAVNPSAGFPNPPPENQTARALRMGGVPEADVAAAMNDPKQLKQLFNQYYFDAAARRSAPPPAGAAPMGHGSLLAISSLRGIPLAGAFVDKGAALLSAAAQPWHDTGLSHAGTIWQREAENEKTIKTETDQFEKEHPIETGIGKAVVGLAATAPLVALGPEALGMAAGEALLPSILKAATAFGTLSAGDTALRGGDGWDIAKSALIGAGGGAAFPLAGKAVEAAAPWLAPMVENFRGGTGRPGEPTPTYRGSPDNFDSNPDVLNVPYEAIPSRDSGHLKGIENQPQEVQDTYSRKVDFRRESDGTDIIYNAVLPRSAPDAPIRQLPTLEAQGFWQLPDRTVQQNLANVARPILKRAPGDPTSLDPESASIFNLAETTRAGFTVQDGIGGQLMTPASRAADINTVRIPTPNGITREQMAELSRRAKLYGLQNASDLGDRVNLTNFAGGGPSGEEISEALGRGMLPKNGIGPGLPPLTDLIHEIVPHAGAPIGEIRTGPYVDLLADWKAEPGSGLVTGKILRSADAAPKEAAERLSNDPEFRKRVQAILDRDQEIDAAHGLPMREDVKNLWRIGAGGDWINRLRAAHARGEYLPAAALAALGLGAAAQNGDARSSGWGDR